MDEPTHEKSNTRQSPGETRPFKRSARYSDGKCAPEMSIIYDKQSFSLSHRTDSLNMDAWKIINFSFKMFTSERADDLEAERKDLVKLMVGFSGQWKVTRRSTVAATESNPSINQVKSEAGVMYRPQRAH